MPEVRHCAGNRLESLFDVRARANEPSLFMSHVQPFARSGQRIQIIGEKRRVAHTYNRFLQDIPGIQTPAECEWALNVYWMYAIVIQPEFGLTRDQLATHLRSLGIDTRTFFCPMNQQPCLQAIPGFRETACPIADRIWETGMYLPSTYTLDEQAIGRICALIGEAGAAGRVSEG